MNKDSTYYPSEQEQQTRARLVELHRRSPIPPDIALEHIELFMRPQRLSEILSLDALYRRVLEVHGIVVEFGVRWGRHMSVFTALRTRYEPHNLYRRIVGFDTFTGFGEPTEVDGDSPRVHRGAMAVTEGYEHYLEQVLALHEAEASGSHVRRFAVVKGDAPAALEGYLEEYPETLVALAYFDMDVYEPTARCLEILRPHMSRGAVLAFDQIGHPDFPGETVALKESGWLVTRKLERFPHAPYPTFVTV